MPRTKLDDKFNRPQRDQLGEMIIGRQQRLGLTNAQLGATIGLKSSSASLRVKQNTREWKLGELLAACKKLDIPIDELREKIKY
ncbi:MAG: hypothetical protein RR058_07985 [Oscillospiraceae bacterium]